MRSIFNKRVCELLETTSKGKPKKFNVQQLEGLPEPVQKYFRLVLKDGQKYISNIKFSHTGFFKTSPAFPWAKIKGEQYYTTEEPGFVWLGRLGFATAIDSYIKSNGSLIVKLFSFFKVVDASGEKINQAELIRWLTEAVLFPTALLPRENLKWLPIDDLTAKLVFNHNDINLDIHVSFKSRGEIKSFQTLRYESEELEKWTASVHNYKEINNVKVPTHLKAVWNKADGDFCYVKFELKELEYDVEIK